jgi:hypothetical protein
MGSLFLSYRRADSKEVVGRIYDRLTARFSTVRVFRDLDSIPLGKPFPQIIQDAVSKSAVAIVILGPAWATILDDNGRLRLNDPSDFVRIEIELALSGGIPVIPVLVAGATMPIRDQLPVSLQSLVLLQAAQVRSDPDFHRDMDRLIGTLSVLVEQPSTGVHGDDHGETASTLITGKHTYDWASEVGERGFDIVKEGLRILFEEHSLDPSFDERQYRHNRQVRIPKHPHAVSPRGFVKLADDDWEWIDPRDRNRRICEGEIKNVLADGRVVLSGRPLVLGDIVDILV